jgi:hypothetical protein
MQWMKDEQTRKVFPVWKMSETSASEQVQESIRSAGCHRADAVAIGLSYVLSIRLR